MNEPKSYLIEITGQMPDAIYERALQEIVRCRDCKYLVDDGSVWVCDGFGANIGFNDGTPPDGYCAWAERQEP